MEKKIVRKKKNVPNCKPQRKRERELEITFKCMGVVRRMFPKLHVKTAVAGVNEMGMRWCIGYVWADNMCSARSRNTKHYIYKSKKIERNF
jgi:hypothetical protein